MNFVQISMLSLVSGYKDRRSIKRWVTSSLGIELHKVGKNWCVIEEEFLQALKRIYAGKTQQSHIPPTAKNQTEKKFLEELNDLILGNHNV